MIASENMGSMGPAAEKPHAVCLPYPAQGHITPMLNVAKLLHARGFNVSTTTCKCIQCPLVILVY